MSEEGNTESFEELEVPNFQPQIPDFLTENHSKYEQWVCAQLSINSQQNNWLIGRARKVDKRQNKESSRSHRIEIRLAALESVTSSVKAKWSVIATFSSVLIIPIFISLIVEWLKSKWGGHKP